MQQRASAATVEQPGSMDAGAAGGPWRPARDREGGQTRKGGREGRSIKEGVEREAGQGAKGGRGGDSVVRAPAPQRLSGRPHCAGSVRLVSVLLPGDSQANW